MSTVKKVTNRHFTPVEQCILLEILKKYCNIIEIKKSDSCTLKDKEKTWLQAMQEYNESRHITQERTVSQIKKLWSNLKHRQRNALTRANQALMSTGGGPKAPSVLVDPDVVCIAPDLMTLAPTVFSSNIKEQVIDTKKKNMNKILEETEKNKPEENCMEIEYLEDEYEAMVDINKNAIQESSNELCVSTSATEILRNQNSFIELNSGIQTQDGYSRQNFVTSQLVETENIADIENNNPCNTINDERIKNLSTEEMYCTRKGVKTNQSKFTVTPLQAATINESQPRICRTKHLSSMSELAIHKLELVELQKQICQYEFTQKKKD